MGNVTTHAHHVPLENVLRLDLSVQGDRFRLDHGTSVLFR